MNNLLDDCALSGLHAMSTPRARLRVMMQKAAMLEQEGCFEDAALYWKAGEELSERESDRHWCEARALLCQKRNLQQQR
ncbi:ANR family transcriptional regulator [Serratia marcescens]|uniref:ANR family transcriptional regulator n=1 Tax=Serratia marcescens TaxID=615 RepID=UPI0011AB7F58|nr:ANR family transcriptional regulator [Serratia marcescens]